MLLKVCGMRDAANIVEVLEVAPDYLGLIFFEKSARFVGHDFELPPDLLASTPKKVGVFVNHTLAQVVEKVNKYGLALAQLHGDESPVFCQQLKDALPQLQVVKVFRVANDFDFAQLKPYKPFCDFFLFDTKGKDYGGNGVVFNWNILKQYDNELPLFMSGGLSLYNIQELQDFVTAHKLRVHAIDVNSKFEKSPALKDVEKLKELRRRLQNTPTQNTEKQ
ncbi:phosphoribosylanthranilate isomerase [Microscilla marina]|uniref:N-(5'-phosphoribosyl)anthranilate isomerase n=1 Tax=Microscilla marina ATCC 23134 TaxID=313606 RepID=A1ZFH2_MICM2|nr:phosphoribosylanthranilate isomerase [Microscilla marina]EAY30746.1 N-(5'phosphoribosyl)anthranilate isomerase [Microscilla marina ATCC 23134]